MYAHLFNDIAGTAVLPTFEVDRAVLAVSGKPIRPFAASTGFRGRPVGSKPGSLTVDAKPFMLAAAKTELARSFEFGVSSEQAFALWVRLMPSLVMDGGPLRLSSQRLFRRKDASETFDSSRIGEGVGHLFMAARGFVYWDHLPTLLEATASGRTVTHAERTRAATVLGGVTYPGEQPDFVCETAAGDVALLECKGSFIPEGAAYSADPSVLRKGLRQLSAWAQLVTPTPAKQFAVGTFLRRDGDDSQEPSMITWVDPPAADRAIDGLSPLPPDAIRRGHYGALLALMGFGAAGRDLRARRKRAVKPRRVATIIIGNRPYVLPFFPPPLRRGAFQYLGASSFFALKRGLFDAFSSALAEPESLLETVPIEARVVEDFSAIGHQIADGSFIGEFSGNARLDTDQVTI
jgi:hypothetical protein